MIIIRVSKVSPKFGVDIKKVFTAANYGFKMMDNGSFFVTKVNIKQKKESHDELFIFYNIKNELNI